MIRDEGIVHLCNCIVNIQLFINKQKDRTFVIFTWISIQALHPLLFLNSHYHTFKQMLLFLFRLKNWTKKSVGKCGLVFGVYRCTTWGTARKKINYVFV